MNKLVDSSIHMIEEKIATGTLTVQKIDQLLLDCQHIVDNLPLDQDHRNQLADLTKFLHNKQQKLAGDKAYSRAFVCMSNRYYGQALEEFNSAICIYPNCTSYYCSRAKLYTTLGRNDLAISDYLSAVDIDSNCLMAHEYLGYAYSAVGQYDAAKYYYGEACRLAPNNPHYNAEKRLCEKRYAAIVRSFLMGEANEDGGNFSGQ